MKIYCEICLDYMETKEVDVFSSQMITDNDEYECLKCGTRLVIFVRVFGRRFCG